MKLAEYKETLTQPIGLRSLCLLIQGERVLLGMKKARFGKGNWTGIGGKPEEEDKTIEETAIRETHEEIGVTPLSLRKVAILNFYFPYVEKPDDWNQQVHVYLVDRWQGAVQETEEIAPKWFHREKIPYDSMWADATYWLPPVLTGKILTASFIFDKDFGIEDVEIIEEKT